MRANVYSGLLWDGSRTGLCTQLQTLLKKGFMRDECVKINYNKSSSH